MSEYITELLRNNDVLLLFLVLAIGFIIGGIRIGTFQLGSVVGVLIAGLWLGNYGFEGNATIQFLGFVLFIFSVGYQAGPRFIKAMNEIGYKGWYSYELCHSLPVKNGQTVGIEYAEECAKYACEMMKGLVTQV